MTDEVIICADCRLEFTLTESEATFFASKGLTKPRRCKACRQKRRDAKASETGISAGAPLAPSTPRGKTQWIGGGEVEAPRRNKSGKRERRRDRDGGHGF